MVINDPYAILSAQLPRKKGAARSRGQIDPAAIYRDAQSEDLINSTPGAHPPCSLSPRA